MQLNFNFVLVSPRGHRHPGLIGVVNGMNRLMHMAHGLEFRH